MSDRTDVIYIYDATFDGFLNCVYSYYYTNLNPIDIVPENEQQASLFEAVTIETDIQKAERVKAAIAQKLSVQCLNFLKECMLTFLEKKEMYMLEYIVKGFKTGAKIYWLIEDTSVSQLTKAHRHLEIEKHRYLGLVRFYKAQDVYVSTIKPKNQILPIIKSHFIQRFANQSFMIYDQTHKQALVYSNNESRIIQVEDIELPQISEDELDNQRLWKLFYDTIAIKERYNPRCRMNFMPKRTWDQLPEMQDLSKIKY